MCLILVLALTLSFTRRDGESGMQSAWVTLSSPQHACSSAVLEKGWSLEQLRFPNESV